MIKVETIFDFLKEKAPLELAESWDNSGMLIHGQKEVNKILVALDVADEVVEEAIEKDCEMIVSHHPVIFKPLKCLDSGSLIGKLIKHDISVISMHTNLDRAEGGVNDVLAGLIGLTKVEEFAELGRIGELSEEIVMKDFAEKVADLLHTRIKYTLPEKMVRKVALIGGSAGEFWTEAKVAGADVYLTGEASHHHCLDAKMEGIAILVGGHWNTECPVLPVVKKQLEEEFVDIEVMVAEKDQDPFQYC